MYRRLLLGLLLALLLAGHTVAQAIDVTVEVNGQTISGISAMEVDGVTYVHIRPLLEALGGWDTEWLASTSTARSETGLFVLSATTGQQYLLVDSYTYEINAPILLRGGRTYVPVRAVSELLGADVTFTGWSAPITVVSTPKTSYTEEDLYWLSRIISAESQGECLRGQIAVGNVVLNRVASSQYPDNIKDVVFDVRDAVQFAPTENGTVYSEPTAKSVLAARLVIDGADAVGDCMYFFNPSLAEGTWIVENCTYYTTIGCHEFYR